MLVQTVVLIVLPGYVLGTAIPVINIWSKTPINVGACCKILFKTLICMMFQQLTSK